MEDLKIGEEEPVQPVCGGGPLPWATAARQGGPRHGTRTLPGVSQAIEEHAENKLIDREFEVLECKLGGPTRSTFLMVFSPDKSLMASTHGDHSIYVTEVRSGKCVQTLKGHPRTPWCIAFHPAHPGIIASGCLGGQVRVWDLHCGSELWTTDGVIASLAFHPVDRLLVIATFNELHFWDWSQPKPFTKVLTINEKEKVRYVKFDSVGHQLVTGIANLSPTQSVLGGDRPRTARTGTTPPPTEGGGAGEGGEGPSGRDEEQRRYNVIMDRYERLMERYHNLTFSRDRGTDPMVSAPPDPPAPPDRPGVGSPPRSLSRDRDRDPVSGPAASRLLSNLAAVATNQLEAEVSIPPAPELEDPGIESRLTRHLLPDGLESVEPPSRGPPRYRRYSLLLDRDDLDMHVHRSTLPTTARTRIVRSPRGTRGREGLPRLRRVDTFREPGNDWSSYRRELRDRMRELGALREARRTLASVGTEEVWSGGAASSEEVRGRGAREGTPPFSHSQDSSFVPVVQNINNLLQVRPTPEADGEDGDSGDFLYMGMRNRSEDSLQEELEEHRTREERLQEELRQRRSLLVAQMEELRSARELLARPNRTSDEFGLNRGINVRVVGGSHFWNRTADLLNSPPVTPPRTAREAALGGVREIIEEAAAREGLGAGAGAREGLGAGAREETRTSESSNLIPVPIEGRNEPPEGEDTTHSPTRPVSPDYRMQRSSSRSFLLRRRYAMTGTPTDRVSTSHLRESIARRSRRYRVSELQRSPTGPNLTGPTLGLYNLASVANNGSMPRPPGDPEPDGAPSTTPSSGRSPGRFVGWDDHGMPAMAPTPRPRTSRGRRSTADAPSTGSISDRLSSFRDRLSSFQTDQQSQSPVHPLSENPFTSRPPSSASEVDIDLASNHNSAVSSPVPRPLTARGRYSMDVEQGTADLTGRSSVDTAGRSSVDSILAVGNLHELRRSFSSDHNPLPRSSSNMDILTEESDISDSNSSRPGSRLTAVDLRRDRLTPRPASVLEPQEEIEDRVSESQEQSIEEEEENRIVALSSRRRRRNELEDGENVRLSSPLDDPSSLLLSRDRATSASEALVRTDLSNSEENLNRIDELSKRVAATKKDVEEKKKKPEEAEAQLRERNETGYNLQSSSDSTPYDHLTDRAASIELAADTAASHFDGSTTLMAVPSGDSAINPDTFTQNPITTQESIAVVELTQNRELSYEVPPSDQASNVTFEEGDSSPTIDNSPLYIAPLPEHSPSVALPEPSPPSTAPTPEHQDQDFPLEELDGDTIPELLPPGLVDTPDQMDESFSPTSDPGSVPSIMRGRATLDPDAIVFAEPTGTAPTSRSPRQASAPTQDDVIWNTPSGAVPRSPRRSGATNFVLNPEWETSGSFSEETESSSREIRRIDNVMRLSLPSAPAPAGPRRRQISDGWVQASADQPEIQDFDPSPGPVEAAPAAAEDQARTEPTSDAGASTSEAGGQEGVLSRRQNMDMALLSRHIDHMQRICQASLADLTMARQRRQIIRLQSIRRMLEDLQRQIRQLRSASGSSATAEGREELAGTDAPPAVAITAERAPRSSAVRSSRYGAPGRGRRASVGLGPPTRLRTPDRSRLTRAHSQLVSQLRATFRAMEMSPDLSHRAISPINESLAEASRTVLERTEVSSTRPVPTNLRTGALSSHNFVTPSPPSSGIAAEARDDLRSMSQRLERLLRQRREAMESSGGAAEERSAGDVNRRRTDLLGERQVGHRANLDSLLNSSSPSDSEEESLLIDPRDSFRRYSHSRTPVRGSRRDNLLDLPDYFDPEVNLGPLWGELGRSSRRGSAAGSSQSDPVWRSVSARERLDIRADLRREAQRERQRLSRERDISRRRQRFRFETARSGLSSRDASSSERLPPLRELIWRRLRRRQQQVEEEEAAAPTQETAASRQAGRDRSRHREMLSWMVDQLTIDHNPADAELPDYPQPPTHRPPGWFIPPPVPDPPTRMYHRYRESFRDGERGPPFREYHFMQHTPSNISLTHRIQTWDFSRGDIPEIKDACLNVVVKEAKIHNDASVDISEDGSLLVTLVPSNLPMTTVVGLYSLRKGNLGACYATYSLESSAVSVSISPTSRHLLVGLTSRTSRIISLSPADRHLMAQVFRVKLPTISGERGRLIHRRDINQVDQGHMSLNCIRWIPVPGQGIVFATNTGLLKMLR